LRVTQGHRNCLCSIGHISLTISYLYKQRVGRRSSIIIITFTVYMIAFDHEKSFRFKKAVEITSHMQQFRKSFIYCKSVEIIKCDFSYNSAAVDKISSCGFSAIAELLAEICERTDNQTNRKQTDIHTYRQADHNTSHPYRGGQNNKSGSFFAMSTVLTLRH